MASDKHERSGYYRQRGEEETDLKWDDAQPKPEFGLDERINKIWGTNYADGDQTAIKRLLRDFVEVVKPERMGEGLQPLYSKGRNTTIDELEANVRKVGL